MKIFKHWMSEKVTIDIQGEAKQITCYGGSNISIEDAGIKAKEKTEKVKRKITGERGIFDDYQVEIREEILQMVDEHAIITRNRYGAKVLNAESLMFLDIDKPKASLGGLFKKSNPQQDKENIYEMVRKLAASAKYAALGFRIYETFQGARVIVLGKNFNPQEPATFDMMKEFNCDPLYTSICRKQGCFRARLTPKPYRIKMKAYKVSYPRDTADSQFETWLQAYERESRNFSVCKLIDQVGSKPDLTEAVRLHDEISGANTNQALA
jgi:hypothetical protein